MYESPTFTADGGLPEIDGAELVELDGGVVEVNAAESPLSDSRHPARVRPAQRNNMILAILVELFISRVTRSFQKKLKFTASAVARCRRRFAGVGVTEKAEHGALPCQFQAAPLS